MVVLGCVGDKGEDNVELGSEGEAAAHHASCRPGYSACAQG